MSGCKNQIQPWTIVSEQVTCGWRVGDRYLTVFYVFFFVGNNALKLRPSFLKARVVRARALLSMGKTEEAIRDLSYAKKGKARLILVVVPVALFLWTSTD